MVISDLSHLEVVSEDNNIVGGEAFSDAYAGSSANGRNFSATYTSTNTYTSSGTNNYYSYYPYYGYYPTNSSSSSSTSHSTAA
ncbi:MAG: hypothetical protein PUP92_25750 [Rhizonema sp. PD38]|nr:hypothetical protein [Rhizonema sp. PD38]